MGGRLGRNRAKDNLQTLIYDPLNDKNLKFDPSKINLPKNDQFNCDNENSNKIQISDKIVKIVGESVDDKLSSKFTSFYKPIVQVHSNMARLVRAKMTQMQKHAERIENLESSVNDVAKLANEISKSANKRFESLQKSLDILWSNNLSHDKVNDFHAQKSADVSFSSENTT